MLEDARRRLSEIRARRPEEIAAAAAARRRPAGPLDASGRAMVLGAASAYTWLKVPVVADMERVIGATTLPTVLLGGEVSEDQDATFAAWGRALRVPGAIGLVVGRSLLYPPGDDVATAVDAAVALLPSGVAA